MRISCLAGETFRQENALEPSAFDTPVDPCRRLLQVGGRASRPGWNGSCFEALGVTGLSWRFGSEHRHDGGTVSAAEEIEPHRRR
jgi:hypothetical protein